MKDQFAFSVGSLFFATALLLPVSTSHAAIETFDPYVFARVLYDSNVFRVSGDNEAVAVLGDTNRDDTIGHLGAGFKTDLKLSRQHILLDAEVDKSKYDNFGDLDHTRIDARATWKWQVGNLWDGNLGYDYEKRLSSFNEQRIPEKDMRTEKLGFFDARYQLTPDWRLVAGLNVKDVSYEKRDRLNRDATAGSVAVQYKNTRNTYVGVRVRYADNDLRDQEVLGVTINNDYKELNVSGVFLWEASAKSKLEAFLGYTEQDYDEVKGREYNGSTYELKYDWEATGKTNVEISVLRDTSTLDDEISSYVLTHGVSVRPTWSVTPLITLSGEVRYTNDDFKGENDIRSALGVESREDDTWFYGIYAGWTPRQYLNLSIGYRREDRDSSTDINDFDDHQIDGKVTVRF